MQYTIFSTQEILLPPRPDDGSTDMEKDASLDIALDYLYLVGGYEMLEKEWGGRREDRNFNSMTSKQYENALKVQAAFMRIGKELKAMEEVIVGKAMTRTTLAEADADQINSTRKRLEERENEIRRNIQNHLMKSNTEKKGLILWLKSGVSLDIRPEPIHLKEIVAFLIANRSFISTGFDVYEVFFLNTDSKYESILRALDYERREEKPPVHARKTLSLDRLLTIKEKYNLPDVSDEALKAWKTSETLKEIVATAQSVWRDVILKKIELCDDCEGYAFSHFRICREELIYYYERLSVRGICVSLLLKFVKEVSVQYQLAPFVRPSDEDESLKESMAKGKARDISMFTSFVSRLMSKPAHNVSEGTEVLARQGRRDSGNGALDGSCGSIDSIVPEGQKRSRIVEVGGETQSLRGLKKARLVEIAHEEGVDFGALGITPKLKQSYVDAIEAHRRTTRDKTTS